MPVSNALSKREFRLLTISRDRTVERTKTSSIIFDKLAGAGLMGTDGRITEAGTEALRRPQEEQYDKPRERTSSTWKLGSVLTEAGAPSGLAGGLGSRSPQTRPRTNG